MELKYLTTCQNSPEYIYRPQQSCEGYLFTPVCQSFCSQGGLAQCMLGCQTPSPDQASPRPGTPPVQAPPRAGTPSPLEQAPPRSRHPLEQAPHPSWSRHPPEQAPQHPPPPVAETATAADGTHPTGMHSCGIYIFNSLSSALVFFICIFYKYSCYKKTKRDK